MQRPQREDDGWATVVLGGPKMKVNSRHLPLAYRTFYLSTEMLTEPIDKMESNHRGETPPQIFSPSKELATAHKSLYEHLAIC
jgi:hypothetical protein